MQVKNRWLYIRGERAASYFKCSSCGTEFNFQRSLDGTVADAEKYRFCSACGTANRFGTDIAPNEPVFQNYKITYTMKYGADYVDVTEVVSAEDEKTAVEYFEWINSRGEYNVCKYTNIRCVGTTNEIADHTCPVGWECGESQHEASLRDCKTWRRQYLSEFYSEDGELKYSSALHDFLIAEGWKPIANKGVDTVVYYIKGNRAIFI